jgi:hypothetical protein
LSGGRSDEDRSRDELDRSIGVLLGELLDD